MKLTTFVNSFVAGNGLSLYLACPLQIRELVPASGKDANGNDLFPSIIVNVPASLPNLRWVKEHEAKRLSGDRFLISLEIGENATFEVKETSSGNKHLVISEMEADLFSVKKQVHLDAEDKSAATPEEEAWLAENQKRIQERKDQKATKNPW